MDVFSRIMLSAMVGLTLLGILENNSSKLKKEEQGLVIFFFYIFATLFVLLGIGV